MWNYFENFLATTYIYMPNSLVGAIITPIGPSYF